MLGYKYLKQIKWEIFAIFVETLNAIEKCKILQFNIIDIFEYLFYKTLLFLVFIKNDYTKQNLAKFDKICFNQGIIDMHYIFEYNTKQI